VGSGDVIRPFRWDVSRLNELGGLLDVELEPYPYQGFVADLVDCSARALAFAGDSDVIFIGRSPEALFDLTSGVLTGTTWQDRLNLLNISLYGGSEAPDRRAVEALKPFLQELGLHPRTVERRSRPITFVDVVDTGSTFGALVELLHDWCGDEGAPWRPVRQRIRFVGLTWREKTSPETYRWHQHADWVARFRPASIKNVSMPGELGNFLASWIPKATAAHPPDRWGDPTIRQPDHGDQARRGLEFARHLFELGLRADIRLRFARELHRQPAVKESWLRSLALEIRR
jgi:hypothetical protein